MSDFINEFFNFIDVNSKEFCENGYVLLKQVVDETTIDIIRTDAQTVFINAAQHSGVIDQEEMWKEPDDFEENVTEWMVKLFEKDFPYFLNAGKLVQNLPELHKLGASDALTNSMLSIGNYFPVICTRPVLYFNMKDLAKYEVFYKSPPHQDWRSMQGSLNSAIAWIPLCDIDDDMGPLEIIPKSHKWGLQDTVEDKWFRHIDGLKDDQFERVNIEKGDILLFSSFLIHRSGNNTSDKIRWSCHFRYNDATEPTFMERKLPTPYVYKPQQELITPDFPSDKDIKNIFKLNKNFILNKNISTK